MPHQDAGDAKNGNLLRPSVDDMAGCNKGRAEMVYPCGLETFVHGSVNLYEPGIMECCCFRMHLGAIAGKPGNGIIVCRV